MSIPATKGFEIGSGFSGTKMFGSQHNDLIMIDPITKKPRTLSNRSGGIQVRQYCTYVCVLLNVHVLHLCVFHNDAKHFFFF
jgi:hypothetical protein